MKKLALALAASTLALSAQAGETTVGGYGELHYNNLSNEDNTNEKREIDFHRYVLFIGKEFTDEIRFFSEFELEHSLAGDGAPGEVELEQAYIEMDLNENHQFKAGLFLIPVGILNETHEPPTFYGVERNRVENQIIPTTWWEAGLGLTGQFGEGFSYDVAFHSGLDVTADAADDSDISIRSGRQKVAEANGRNFAGTARLKYTGIEGLELAATVQIQDDIAPTPNTGDNASAPELSTANQIGGATLIETHARYNIGNFGFTALYAQWNIDVEDGSAFKPFDEQKGFYTEVSYRISDAFGVAVRHSDFETHTDRPGDEQQQQTYSLNYWPHEQVVLKADIQVQDRLNESDELNGFNLGVGYQF